MAFKINVSESGKTYHLELESEELLGKKIGDKINGNEISGDLAGYELEITGTSDKAGFPGKKEVKGILLRGVLLKKGPFMRKTPHKGFRGRKNVRGNEISPDILQINMNVVKKGHKPLAEIFPDQGAGKSKDKKE
ncbi:MAG: S6e family ribosomal protein [Nanoarchaeota archaeon]